MLAIGARRRILTYSFAGAEVEVVGRVAGTCTYYVKVIKLPVSYHAGEYISPDHHPFNKTWHAWEDRLELLTRPCRHKEHQ